MQSQSSFTGMIEHKKQTNYSPYLAESGGDTISKSFYSTCGLQESDILLENAVCTFLSHAPFKSSWISLFAWT